MPPPLPAFVAAVALVAGSPTVVRTFLRPAPAVDTRPRTWSFWATWLVAVLPVWLIAPAAWAVALHAVWLCAEDDLGKRSVVDLVLLGWAVIEIVWSIYTAYRVRSVQPALAAKHEVDHTLRAMFAGVIRAGLHPSDSTANGAAVVDPSGDKSRNKEGEETLAKVLDVDGPSSDRKKGDEPDVIVRLSSTDPRAVAFRERMRTWFFGARWEDLQRENILDWIAWSSFTASSHTLLTTEHQKEALSHALDLVERRTGTIFPPGRNRDVQIMRLTLDPVKMHHRPLIAYLVTESVNVLCMFDMRRRGVKRMRFGSLDYLVRLPSAGIRLPASSSSSDSLVFIHGLGFGHLQNYSFLLRLLNDFPDRPLVVPVQQHISMTIFGKRYLRPHGRQEVVESLREALIALGLFRLDADDGQQGGVTIVSHSNGSTSHAWILKDAPELTRRNLFIDPVVFCLWEGDVCYNFVYRRPKTPIELLLAYWIGGDLGISHTISRWFDWSHNTLFLSAVPEAHNPRKFSVVLGGKDAILDASRVKEYLTNHGAAQCVLWSEEAPHGDVLFSRAKADKVVAWLKGEGET